MLISLWEWLKGREGKGREGARRKDQALGGIINEPGPPISSERPEGLPGVEARDQPLYPLHSCRLILFLVDGIIITFPQAGVDLVMGGSRGGGPAPLPPLMLLATMELVKGCGHQNCLFLHSTQCTCSHCWWPFDGGGASCTKHDSYWLGSGPQLRLRLLISSFSEGKSDYIT